MSTSVRIATAALPFLLLVLTSIPTASSAAQGPYFRALQSGRATAVTMPTAMLAKLYIGVTLSHLEQECRSPGLTPAEEAENLRDAALLMVQPKHRDAAPFYLVYAASVRLWSEANDGAADMRAYLRTTSCASAVRAWIPIARAALRDVRIAAPVDSFAAIGCRRFSDGGTVMGVNCDCFAGWFNRESTPVSRQHLVGVTDTLGALRAAMRDGDIHARIEMRCVRMPSFTTGPIGPTVLRGSAVRDIDFRLRSFRQTLDAQSIRTWSGPSYQFFRNWTNKRRVREPLVLTCHYGPPVPTDGLSDHTPSSRYFWSAKQGGPSQEEVASAFAGSPFLPIIMDIVRVQLDECPPTLTAADALKAAAPQSVGATGNGSEPSSTPPVTSPGERETSAPARPAPTEAPAGETREERGRRIACERKQVTIKRLRGTVLRGQSPASQLLRLEAEYRAQCGGRA